jgi:hypothetical protein
VHGRAVFPDALATTQNVKKRHRMLITLLPSAYSMLEHRHSTDKRWAMVKKANKKKARFKRYSLLHSMEATVLPAVQSANKEVSASEIRVTEMLYG